MGATASRLWWPDDLVGRLDDAGRHAFRHDSRDTGRSSIWPPGARLVTLDGAGHDLSGHDRDTVAAAIIAHTDRTAVPRIA